MNLQTTNQIKTGIQFSNISDFSLEHLLACFNDSFKNYFVPLQLTKQQLIQKIITEKIELHLSVGAFDDDKLIGFILQGLDIVKGKRTAYNAGTGVLPRYRGSRLTGLMYKHALDILSTHHVHRSVLEVIDENVAALQVYKQVGFTICRQLDSFQSPGLNWPNLPNRIFELPLQELELLDLDCEWNPAWQYSNSSLARAFPDYKMFVAYRKSTPVAYCIVNIATGRLAQFGCHNFEENDCELKALLSHIENLSKKKISLIHVDHCASRSINFLKAAGFVPLISAYEMKLTI